MNSKEQNQKAYRDPYWLEIDDATKIMRLRLELKRAQRDIQMLRERINTMEEHRHANGAIVIPVNIPRVSLARITDSEDQYF
jgi:hypothetical protein